MFTAHLTLSALSILHHLLHSFIFLNSIAALFRHRAESGLPVTQQATLLGVESCCLSFVRLSFPLSTARVR